MIAYIFSTLVFMAIVAIVMFLYKKFLIQAKPDEWMLVLRNGKLIKHGVGISTVKQLFD
jgi:hypothetical protein